MTSHIPSEIIKTLEWVRDYDLPKAGDTVKQLNGEELDCFSDMRLIKSMIDHVVELIKSFPVTKAATEKVGKHRNISETKFESKEVAMGKEVEKEHSDNPLIAIEILKDHLAEIPDYYSRLKVMEQKDFWDKWHGEKIAPITGKSVPTTTESKPSLIGKTIFYGTTNT